MIFRLRHVLADSPTCPAESDSFSYGLSFHFQLLSTPLRSDAVTFSYNVMAYVDRDFHPIDKLPSWAHECKLCLHVRQSLTSDSEILFIASYLIAFYKNAMP